MNKKTIVAGTFFLSLLAPTAAHARPAPTGPIKDTCPTVRPVAGTKVTFCQTKAVKVVKKNHKKGNKR